MLDAKPRLSISLAQQVMQMRGAVAVPDSRRGLARGAAAAYVDEVGDPWAPAHTFLLRCWQSHLQVRCTCMPVPPLP